MAGDFMSIDERVLRQHIGSPAFTVGVAQKKWRIIGDLKWPHVLIAIAAAPRETGPPEFFFRFDLTDYPASPPTATLWNYQSADVLEEHLRPKGGRAQNVCRIVWSEPCLYAPFDRVALTRYPDWPQQFPNHAWNADRDLAWVLRYLHELLNDDEYKGI